MFLMFIWSVVAVCTIGGVAKDLAQEHAQKGLSAHERVVLRAQELAPEPTNDKELLEYLKALDRAKAEVLSGK